LIVVIVAVVAAAEAVTGPPNINDKLSEHFLVGVTIGGGLTDEGPPVGRTVRQREGEDDGIYAVYKDGLVVVCKHMAHLLLTRELWWEYCTRYELTLAILQYCTDMGTVG
jgi:hypothetical protein